MLNSEERELAYSEGYTSIPPLTLGELEMFSSVAHSQGLEEIAWRAGASAILDAFERAVEEKNLVVGRWLHTHIAIMMIERDESQLGTNIKS